MKGPALQNQRVGVLRIAFRMQKVLGTFEKRAPAGAQKKPDYLTLICPLKLAEFED